MGYQYDYLFQFDGNLTDDSANNVTLSADSGTATYVTSEDGQGLDVDASALSATVRNGLAFNALYGMQFKVRVNTGATDGIIWAIDNGTKPVFQCGISGSNFYFYTFTGSGSLTSANRPRVLNSWDAVGVSWGSAIYCETEGGGLTSGTNYNSETYWPYGSGNDWDDRENMRLLIGQAGNTAGNGGLFNSGTVATGVELDWICGSFLNEGRSFSQPLGGDYGPRTEVALPASASRQPHTPSIVVAKNSNLSFDNAQLVGPTGGGGPVAPAIKEFWS